MGVREWLDERLAEHEAERLRLGGRPVDIIVLDRATRDALAAAGGECSGGAETARGMIVLEYRSVGGWRYLISESVPEALGCLDLRGQWAPGGASDDSHAKHVKLHEQVFWCDFTVDRAEEPERSGEMQEFEIVVTKVDADGEKVALLTERPTLVLAKNAQQARDLAVQELPGDVPVTEVEITVRPFRG